MKLSERLSKINKSLNTVGEGKVDLAIMLYEIKASEYWPETKYGSWKNFCNTEVALSQSAILVYLKTVKLAKNNNFRITDMKHITNVIGWERLRIGLSKTVQSEPVNVVMFIKKYKNLNLNERVTYAKGEGDLVNFSFNVPESTAVVFNAILTTHGMRTTNKTRSEMSTAMIKLVDYMEQEF